MPRCTGRIISPYRVAWLFQPIMQLRDLSAKFVYLALLGLHLIQQHGVDLVVVDRLCAKGRAKKGREVWLWLKYDHVENTLYHDRRASRKVEQPQS